MANNQTRVDFEPFFGGFVLETLTIGMYGEARNAIREYIQNGFDSIQRAIIELKILPAGDGLIEIELEEDRGSLTIRDNGAGLTTKTAADVLTRVGASSKSHSKNAGFRGIGRLAGIVFSDTVTFTTKAKHEHEQTTVIFDAKAMRAAMSPVTGSRKSALSLMKESVVAFRSYSPDVNRHFFEVRLEGFTDAPNECCSPKEMYDFVSQVAPVPYSDDFPYLNELRNAAKKFDIPIEEVRITIKDGNAEPKPITKQYGATYVFDSGTIQLNACDIHNSETNQWWAWVGKKAESGTYTNSRVSGLRVRVRNIQIDGTAVIRDIFRDHAPSHVRFQDYFLGEVFIEPRALVPNARRDGFEENAAWKRIRNELAEVVRELGKEAYRVSRKGQQSVEALNKSLQIAKKEMNTLRKGNFSDTDRVIALSMKVSGYQSRVARGALGASMETAAKLQAIGSALADIKLVALTHVGSTVAAIDREKVQRETRDGFLREILSLLEEALSPVCFSDAQEALREEFGEE